MKRNNGMLVLVHLFYATHNTIYRACSKVKDAITHLKFRRKKKIKIR